MNELIPVVAGMCLIAIPLPRHAAARAIACALGILLVALGATLLSGEYRLSWGYIAADSAETAAGLLAASLARRWVRVRWPAQTAFPTRN